MADRVEHLQRMVSLVEALVQDGFGREEIAEISTAAAVAHVDGDAQVPYARGNCCDCGAVQVAWTEYHAAVVASRGDQDALRRAERAGRRILWPQHRSPAPMRLSV